MGVGYSVADAMTKAFGVQPRRPDDDEEVSRAIEEQKQRGDANLFDTAEQVMVSENESESDDDVPIWRKKAKKVHTQVSWSTQTCIYSPWPRSAIHFEVFFS